MKERIYLDHAATTPVDEKVLEAMMPYFCNEYANPSAIYSQGKRTKQAVEEARRMLASTVGALPEEIFFTSGGTESDNWAIKMIAQVNENKGKHIITSKIEHHAVLHTCEYLEERGFEVTYLPVDQFGQVSKESLLEAIRPDTVLISIMAVNNEIGTIQPIASIGKIAKEKGILFHVDAVAAYGQIPIDVKYSGVDLLSVSGHKIYGPKGVGFLYVKNDIGLEPFIHGGGQENEMRSGTENVAGIVGLATAARLAQWEMNRRTRRERMLRDEFIHSVLTQISGSMLNGHPFKRVASNASFCFEGVNSKELLMQLDENGIYASVGSACAAGAIEASHVLLAIGREDALARQCLRISLGKETTAEQMHQTFQILKEAIRKQRS